MPDRILSIGQSALESSDAKVKAMMNNIVNAQTPGYKKSDVSIKSFPLMLENETQSLESGGRSGAMMPKVTGVFRDQAHGPIFKTGGATDAAIGGDGYFVLQGNEGEVFTRDGRFTLDQDGKLISISGKYPVLGKSGPIVVIPGSSIAISQNGSVLVDDVQVDMLRVVVFNDPKKLEPINNSLFKASSIDEATYEEDDNPRVIQGYIESSNVSIMDEYMEMILLSRMYDGNTKIIQSRDAALAKAIELGKPAQ
ncbi:MAG: flagellar hook-basal body protein [Candidatus Saganbacteria bacterium]|nr:flagellar hook-basal body protein [Candidatus Saganbacteria bacterium]